MFQQFDASTKRMVSIALSLVSAIVIFSCKGSIEKTDALSTVDTLSTQTVRGMEFIETKYGMVATRLQAPLMENYSLLPDPFQIFPEGITVITYTPDGECETKITANSAIHYTQSENERWEVYGNVIIINYIEEQTLTTDTLYWDQANQRIFTNAFVKIFSPQGLMQGYGMESDEKAYNAVILTPFNSYRIFQRDSLSPSQPSSTPPRRTPSPPRSSPPLPSPIRPLLTPVTPPPFNETSPLP